MISPYNHGSSKVERKNKTISDIIVKQVWGKGQMWPLFVTTAAYAMNTFASEALNGFFPFQLVFVHNPPDLTSLSFPKIDTIPIAYREYYNLLLARTKLLVDYCLIGELNKHLNSKIEVNNSQRKKFLKMINWYTC